MRVGTIAMLAWLCAVGLNVVEAQTETITDPNQIVEAFNGDVFSMPIDPPDFRAWLIDPQFFWADFANLPEQFSAALAESQEQLQGVTVLKLRLTRDILTGETLVEFPSSTNSISLAAPAGYSTNGVDSASRSSLQVWRQYIEWGALDENTVPTLRLDVALADVQDKAAYDAALAAEEAACAETSAGMRMSTAEESGSGDEFSVESFDPCSTTNLLMLSISKVDDSWMKLVWTSHSNTLYTVQYADELTTSTVWRTAKQDYPSQGCSTLWSDAGDSLAIPFRDRPKDVTKRFYRVMESELLTNGVPTVSVSIVSNNAVNGITIFGISATATNGKSVDTTTLYIDGVPFGDAITYPYQVTVDTRKLSNGAHVVYATADDSGGDVEPGETDPNADTSTGAASSGGLSITTSNLISNFSVKYQQFRPDLGQLQEISAQLQGATNWTVNIISVASNTVVHSFSGNSASIDVFWDGTGSGLQPFGFYTADLNAGDFGETTVTFVMGHFGTAGVMWQGHHPPNIFHPFGSYSPPGTGVPGQHIQFTSGHNPPWGRINSAHQIGEAFKTGMMFFGYDVPVYKGDDQVFPYDLRKASAGGSNTFNNVNLGLYIGHASASKNFELSIGFPVAYIPIWHTDGSYDWVRTTQSDFGSTNLHWMAMLVCNYFRDDPQDYPIYQEMKNHLALPMNTGLHVFCGYKSTVIVHHVFASFWIKSLVGLEGTQNSSVLNAWKRARTLSQPNGNYQSRSIYWQECSGDHIYGYGSQTDPSSNNTQADLLEDDAP
jgi:hypothetical protein